MSGPYFSADTLDDVMRDVVEEILSRGEQINPTKGPATELTGVLLEVTNPRARLSRTETRGKPFSCLGELCWYLAKTNDKGFISYYLRHYEEYADGDVIYGGYGPRVFDWRGQDQWANVIGLLKKKPDSRQAVIQLFDASDIVEDHSDVPCTCTLQFMIRRGELHMFTNMRSNDAFLGLPHDIFSFTMLQEIMARTLGVQLGTYKHAVGSLHLYDQDLNAAQRFLDEGWQPTDMSMPAMPSGDPWPAIDTLLGAESALRSGLQFDVDRFGDLNSYWADLIRLLQVFRYLKEKNANEIRIVRDRMYSDTYRQFIEARLMQLR
jgi:thymidylate synthase